MSRSLPASLRSRTSPPPLHPPPRPAPRLPTIPRPLPASLRSRTWPPRLNPPRSAWPPSASSCPCSRTTFDPAGLSERLGALETEMGAPGFWDDPEAAAKVGAEHTRLQRRLDAFTKLQADAEDLEGLAEIAEEDEDLASELED